MPEVMAMSFNREHEIARSSSLPDWMWEFADCALRRSAEGSNPFQELKGLFRKNKELGAIEERVREFRDRIGLSLLAEQRMAALEPNVRTASSSRHGRIDRLARLANWLDGLGLAGEADEVDGMIRALAAGEGIRELFREYPKLESFLDNVFRSRGGHVTVPALLKMIRDERPDESGAASSEVLRDYLKERIGKERQEVNDGGDSIAGLGVGLSTSWEDIAENNRMFEQSKPAR
jgi:hypothetical protein